MKKEKHEEKKPVAATPEVVAPPAEEPQLHLEKDVVFVAKEEEVEIQKAKEEATTDVSSWVPKTSLGKDVKAGRITSVDQILSKGLKILEPEIVEMLVPGLEVELLMVGQSKGKFGGGARRIFRQTQKKTPEGNKPSFATVAVVGNKAGYVGVGFGKSKDTVPAREKAVRNAKLNLFKVSFGCGSWDCRCGATHSMPYTVEGKCGALRVKLMPAPKGKGLIIEKELSKILSLAGFKDVWSKTEGQCRITMNAITATVDALQKIGTTKTAALHVQKGRKHHEKHEVAA